jgi:hypothetical protein
MKKLVLSAAVALMAITANAQDATTSTDITFGAKAGLNLANVGGDIDDADSKLGFHVGGYAEFMVSEKFSVQPELVFSQQGYKFEESYTEDFGGEEIRISEEAKTKLNYLNLPVMAKFYVADGFSLEVGPQVGFLLSAEEEYEGTATFEDGSTESISETEDIKDFVSSIDFAVGVGAGYKLDGGLNFAVRYNLGLSNINDFEGSDDFKAQNNVFQFSVGYSF